MVERLSSTRVVPTNPPSAVALMRLTSHAAKGAAMTPPVSRASTALKCSTSSLQSPMTKPREAARVTRNSAVLTAWVPAAKAVADGEDAFFGAGSFFVAACSSEDGVVALGFDGFDEGDGLEGVSGAVGAFLEVAAVDPVLDFGNA